MENQINNWHTFSKFRKQSLTFSGLVLIVVSIILGTLWMVDSAYIASFLSFGLFIVFSQYIWKYRNSPRNLYWVPMTIFIILMIDFWVFNLRLESALFERFVHVLVCFLPLLSVQMCPPGKVYRMVVYLPAFISFLAGANMCFMGLEHQDKRFNSKNGTVAIYLQGDTWVMDTYLRVYKIKSIFPGLEKRKCLKSIYSEYGGFKFHYIEDKAIVYDHTDSRIGQQKFIFPTY